MRHHRLAAASLALTLLALAGHATPGVAAVQRVPPHPRAPRATVPDDTTPRLILRAGARDGRCSSMPVIPGDTARAARMPNAARDTTTRAMPWPALPRCDAPDARWTGRAPLLRRDSTGAWLLSPPAGGTRP